MWNDNYGRLGGYNPQIFYYITTQLHIIQQHSILYKRCLHKHYAPPPYVISCI